MSHDASIEVHVAAGYAVLDALKALREAGWSYDDHGAIRFLPLGSGNQYDWQSRPLTEWDEVERELRDKQRAGEVVGVALLWRDTLRGGEVLFFNERITMSASSNRLPLASSEFTDFSWYLERFVPALANADVRLLRVACSDCK